MVGDPVTIDATHLTKIILISFLLLASTVAIHATGTELWMRHVLKRFVRHDGTTKPNRRLIALMMTGNFLMLLHLFEILLWAVTYRLLPGITNLTNMSDAFYFSLVTFTTLGYGDIVLGPKWRLMSGMEAINGIVLFGWSTAFLFALVQRSWKEVHKPDKE